MEDIIVSLEPAFHRVERFILWKNRYASLLAFALAHAIFYAIARAGLRPFCAITLVILIFHILDSLKQKRAHLIDNEDKNLCELTQLVLRSYRHLCQTHEKLNTLKTENRVKYSIIIIAICLTLAVIGVKINGFYVSYITMLILFTLPAVVYHKLIPKLLRRLAPVIEQLDQSMQYQRRSLLDQRELLVKLDRTTSNNDDDDVRRLEEQRKILQQEALMNKQQRQRLTLSDDEREEEETEEKLISTNDQSETILNLRHRFQNEPIVNDSTFAPKQTSMGESSFDMLSDSSSSTADDETNRLSELYANAGGHIDGKHRIRMKNDELKVKGRSNKQRPKLMDAQYFQSPDLNSSSSTLTNTAANQSSNDPDLTSFDFLNDYDEKA
ncbi:unnamed protein product [Adineta ricciae]|uniref:Reticulon domain-containing protein n=1 Tax=Adineta ricciae TaxID=249248 RepID=A0A814WAE4_ADIRI|nr:unnamed protein product [Adineta ricciae]